MSKCLVMRMMRVTFIWKKKSFQNQNYFLISEKILLLWLCSLDLCCIKGLGTPGATGLELDMSSIVIKVPPVCSKVEELVNKCCSSKITDGPWWWFNDDEVAGPGVQDEYLAVGEVDLLAKLAKSLVLRYCSCSSALWDFTCFLSELGSV